MRRRIPLDPPWLLVIVLAGFGFGLASVWNESWSIAVTYAGLSISAAAGALGIDRWLERYRPRRRR